MQSGALSAQQWLGFKNTDAGTVPAFGIMRVTDVSVVEPGRVALQCAKPNSYGDIGQCMINGPAPVASGQYGTCTRSGLVTALYDSADGTPGFGDSWGPRSGTWKLKKNTGGFLALGAPTNTTQFLALFEPIPIRSLLVNKATDTLWGNSGTFTIFSGTQGSESAESGTISAYVRRGICLASSLYEARQMVNGWEIVNPTLVGIRGQFSADLAPDTAATMQRWAGTNGSESSTGISFSVWNASACTVKGNKMVSVKWVDDNNTFHVETGKT